MSVEAILQRDKDKLREGFLKYTRKAFHLLPPLDRPRILDVGCGSGIPTMELAALSKGEITGLDIDQPSLDRLAAKIKAAGLSHRVRTLKCSLLDMDFPDGSFNIIWAEGSISPIGFERALKEWRRFLKPEGFLVFHDETGNIAEKLEQVSRCGYELLGHFIVSQDAWWKKYYVPLEKRINKMRKKYAGDPRALAALEEDEDRRFIETFRKNPERYSSAFFVMKKR